MRLKNLNLFEKYIEKSVLVMGGFYALFVLWFFVIGSPHAVELSGLHATLKPGEIEEAILEEVKDLDRRISTTESPFKLLEVPPYTNEFRGRLTRPLIPVERFSTYFGLPGLEDKGIDGDPPIQEYYLPPVPVVSNMIWDTGFGVLDEPGDPAMAQAFEKLIGNQKPRDFRWVSVSAQFNMKEWRARLEAKAPPHPRESENYVYIKIPKNLWRDRLIVTDVILQRQLQNPQTGAWGEIETLPTVPGTDSHKFLNNTIFEFRKEQASWAPAEKDAALALASIEQKRLPRPLFPELTEGLWLPPDANSQTMTPAMAEQVRGLVSEIQLIQKQIKDLKQRIADGTGPIAAPATPSDPADPNTATVAMDLPALEARMTTKREALYILLGIIEPVEIQTDVMDRNTRVGALRRNPRTIADTREEEENATPDTIRVWQHDISVQDGQSLRYRIIVKVLNPLFFQPQVPKTQHEEYFEKFTLASNEKGTPVRQLNYELQTPWTEPVQVLSEHHFFLSGASKATQTTTIEVYCIFNGQWQRREFDVKPGDPIGQMVQFQLDGETKNVNMNVGGVVVDIDYDAPSAESPNKKTTRLIYYDGKTNTLQTRTLEEDQDNTKREELRRNLKGG